jgi:hypothetical protein
MGGVFTKDRASALSYFISPRWGYQNASMVNRQIVNGQWSINQLK